MMKVLIISFSFALLFCSCHKSSDQISDFEKNQNPYFPLKKGNSWTYYNPSHLDDTLRITVAGYAIFDDKVYAKVFFAMYDKGSKRFNCTNYWSYGDSGKIIIKEDPSYHPEIRMIPKVYYSTMKGPGEVWDVSVLNADRVYLKAKYDTISLNKKKYFNCIQYFVEEFVGEWQRDEYLVKNIGLVHISPYEICKYDLK